MKARKLRKTVLAMALSAAMLLQPMSELAIVNAQEAVAVETEEEVSAETTEEVDESSEEQKDEAKEEETTDDSEETSEKQETEETETEKTEESDSEKTEETKENEEDSEAEDADEIETTEEQQEETVTEAPTYTMPESYVLTEEEKALKQDLAMHINDYDNLTAGVDFVEREFIILIDTYEEAQVVADAYGAELAKFDTGVATLRIKDQSMMKEVLTAAASLDNNLPAIWPNGIRHAYGETEVAAEEETNEADEETAEEGKTVVETEEGLIIEEETLPADNADVQEMAYNDPYLKATSSTYQWQHATVGSYSAWNQGYTGSGIKVAVLDSGVLNGHEDLPTITALGCHAEDLTGKSNSHGTHVAGIIGARGNNGKGGSGIAPSVTLYSGCVLPGGSGSDTEIIAGINKAIAQGVDIINMSLGGIGYSAAYDQAVTNAYNKGVAVFVAAGNDGGCNYDYPAACKDAITIAATSPDNTRAFFSNWGNHVELSAPGTDIYSTSNSKTGYEFMSGTSQATPVAAGTAAVILGSDPTLKSMAKGPEKVSALVKIMQQNAVAVNAAGMGKGIAKLTKVFNLAEASIAPTAPAITLTPSGANIRVDIKAQTGTTIYYRTDGKVPTYKNGMIGPDGATYTYSGAFTIYAGTTSKNVKAIAVNEAGLVSPVKATTFRLDSKVTSISVSGVTNIAKGKGSQLTATVYPVTANNKALTWTLYKKGSGTPLTQADQRACGVSITAGGKVVATKTAVAGSSYTAVATAKDGSNVSGSITVNIIEASKIASVKFVPNKITMTTGQSLTPVMEALNIDKSAAKATDFVWTTNNVQVATVNASGVIYAMNEGKAVITATANDSSGKKAVINVTVNRLVSSVSIYGPSVVAAGKAIQLQASVNPSNASNKALTWTISQAEGLKVTPTGKVTTTAKTPAGKYTVTAKAKDGSEKYGTYTVTVTASGITKFELADKNDKNVTIFRVKGNTGAPVNKTIYLNTEGMNTNCFEAVSSNPGVAGVSYSAGSGKPNVFVYSSGKTAGNTVITVRSTDGTNKTLKINVKVNNPASRMNISLPAGRSYIVGKGKSLQLKAVFETGYGQISNPGVEWKVTSGADVVSVTPTGVVKVSRNAAIGGQYTITATTKDGTGLSASYTIVTVNPTTYIYLANNNSLVRPGMTFTGARKGEIYGLQIISDSLYPAFNVSSSNPAVATATINVQNGYRYLVFACDNPGKTTITISSIDGCKSVKYSFVVVK